MSEDGEEGGYHNWLMLNEAGLVYIKFAPGGASCG